MTKLQNTPLLLPHKIKDWRGTEKEEFINNGAYARVYRVSPSEIVKKIPSTKNADTYLGELLAQTFTNTALSKIWDISFTSESINIRMSYSGDLCLIDILRDNEYLMMLPLMRIAFDLTKGLAYMHRLGYAHMDINPNNIVWDSTKSRAQIVDFGSTREADTWARIPINFKYHPPELTENNNAYHKIDIKIDCWSCGIIFLDLHARIMEKPLQVFFLNESKPLLSTKIRERGLLYALPGRIRHAADFH